MDRLRELDDLAGGLDARGGGFADTARTVRLIREELAALRQVNVANAHLGAAPQPQPPARAGRYRYFTFRDEHVEFMWRMSGPEPSDGIFFGKYDRVPPRESVWSVSRLLRDNRELPRDDALDYIRKWAAKNEHLAAVLAECEADAGEGEHSHTLVDFADFASAVSDAVWGGELGWDRPGGLKALATAVRNLVRRKPAPTADAALLAPAVPTAEPDEPNMAWPAAPMSAPSSDVLDPSPSLAPATGQDESPEEVALRRLSDPLTSGELASLSAGDNLRQPWTLLTKRRILNMLKAQPTPPAATGTAVREEAEGDMFSEAKAKATAYCQRHLGVGNNQREWPAYRDGYLAGAARTRPAQEPQPATGDVRGADVRVFSGEDDSSVRVVIGGIELWSKDFDDQGDAEECAATLRAALASAPGGGGEAEPPMVLGNIDGVRVTLVEGEVGSLRRVVLANGAVLVPEKPTPTPAAGVPEAILSLPTVLLALRDKLVAKCDYGAAQEVRDTAENIKTILKTWAPSPGGVVLRRQTVEAMRTVLQLGVCDPDEGLDDHRDFAKAHAVASADPALARPAAASWGEVAVTTSEGSPE